MASTVSRPEPKSKSPQAENIWVNLILNLILPSVILKKGSHWLGVSDTSILVIALTFPLFYGIYDFSKRRKYNLFSILGFVSILLTGSIGLLALNPKWIAIKEASIPLILGIVLLISSRTKYPLIRVLFYNEQMLNISKIDKILKERNTYEAFEHLIQKCTWLFGFSFFLSAILNYFLAKLIVTTDPKIDLGQFNNELSDMFLWSWPVITIPTFAISIYAFVQLIKGIKQFTGLDIEAALNPTIVKKTGESR